MAEGDVSTSLDLRINVLEAGTEKINEVAKKLQKLGDKAKESANSARKPVEHLDESLNAADDAAEETTNSFMELTGQGLALLFAGRFLSKVFGSLASSMFDLLGVNDMLSATMTAILIPAFVALAPFLFQIMAAFIEMDDNLKMIIGAMVAAAAVIAPIIMILGQLVAAAAAFGITVGALIGIIIGVVAAVGLIVGALLLLERRTGIVTDFISAVVDNITDMISFISNVFAGEWEDAWDDLTDIVSRSVDFFRDNLGDLFDWIIDTFTGLGSKLLDAGKDLGERMLDGIVDIVKSGASRLKDAVMDIVPDISLDGIGSSVGGSLPSFGVNDFVMTGDRLLKTHPNDVIMGMRDPENLGAGGENGGGDTIVVKDPTVRDDRDIDKMVDEIEKRLDRKTRGRSSIR